jgi:hypothetical protein
MAKIGPILAMLTMHYFKKSKNKKCTNQTLDYAKYHTIIHLLANSPIGTVEKGGKKINAYIATAKGKDPVTGQKRRIGLSVDFNSLFSGAGTRGNPAKMSMRAGDPGTRITFDGDENDPFEPVPGLHVWQGAMDIDPECGLVIHAEKAK